MIIDIITGVTCSLAASVVFWYLTYRYSFTKIKFSDCIEKSVDAYDKKQYRYRIRLINIGRRDLLEVTYTVRLSIKRGSNTNNTYLGLGYSCTPPILHGRKWQNKYKIQEASWKFPLQMTDSTYEEFSKRFYTKEIREAAQNKTLTLDKIFSTYKERIEIIIYACGYDAFTGRRIMFNSKKYSVSDIQCGVFNKSKEYKKYTDYVNHILSISSPPRKQYTMTKPVQPYAKEADLSQKEAQQGQDNIHRTTHEQNHVS